ncbi:hypothetical protein C8R47DRAFT_1154665 [Mycena vitilis]|nr:hypothetical protein C8R47DRAFT_1154665 [Mycena vitilis]
MCFGHRVVRASSYLPKQERRCGTNKHRNGIRHLVPPSPRNSLHPTPQLLPLQHPILSLAYRRCHLRHRGRAAFSRRLYQGLIVIRYRFSRLWPRPRLLQFGMTPAVAHASASPTSPSFPSPPVIASPPPGKKRRYARSIKSLYKGDGTGTSLRTNRATVPADGGHAPRLRRRASYPFTLEASQRVAGAQADDHPRPLPPPHRTHTDNARIGPTRSTSLSAVTSMAHGRALSFKSTKSEGKARTIGVEHIAPTAMHSFSG